MVSKPIKHTRSKFGKMITIERIKKDMSSKDLAVSLGVSEPFITCIARGSGKLSVSRAAQLFNILAIQDTKPFWTAYYLDRKYIPTDTLSDKKRLAIIELLMADLSDEKLDKLREVINGES